MFVWAIMLWYLMYKHADRMQQSAKHSSKMEKEGKCENDKDNMSCLAESDALKPFVPFVETRSPWHILEQRYYSLNKERLEEELNSQKKASVDISLMEHRVRRIAAALEVEKDQRRALEDRMYARVSAVETESTTSAPNLEELL